MARARRTSKSIAEVEEAAAPVVSDAPMAEEIEAAARAVVAPGERVRFITATGVVCEAVVVRIDWMNGIELRVRKPSGMTFITFADEGEGPDTFQREA
jgi:hypothetical protein